MTLGHCLSAQGALPVVPRKSATHRLVWLQPPLNLDPRPACSPSGHPTPSSSTMTVRSVNRRRSLTWIVPARSSGNACFNALVANSFTISPIRIACRESMITFSHSTRTAICLAPRSASPNLRQTSSSYSRMLPSDRRSQIKLELILTLCDDVQPSRCAFQS